MTEQSQLDRELSMLGDLGGTIVQPTQLVQPNYVQPVNQVQNLQQPRQPIISKWRQLF